MLNHSTEEGYKSECLLLGLLMYRDRRWKEVETYPPVSTVLAITVFDL